MYSATKAIKTWHVNTWLRVSDYQNRILILSHKVADSQLSVLPCTLLQKRTNLKFVMARTQQTAWESTTWFRHHWKDTDV